MKDLIKEFVAGNAILQKLSAEKKETLAQDIETWLSRNMELRGIIWRQVEVEHYKCDVVDELADMGVLQNYDDETINDITTTYSDYICDFSNWRECLKMALERYDL